MWLLHCSHAHIADDFVLELLIGGDIALALVAYESERERIDPSRQDRGPCIEGDACMGWPGGIPRMDSLLVMMRSRSVSTSWFI